MAMIQTAKHFALRPDSVFLVLLGGAWCIASKLFLPEIQGVGLLGYLIIATLSGFILAHSLGYFESLRLVPRQSDLLLVLLAITLGGGIGRLGIEFLTGRSLGGPLHFLWVSLGVGAITYTGHALWCRVLVSRGRRRTIVLAVSESEQEAIKTEYIPGEIGRYVDFVGLAELREALDEGGVREIDHIIISRLGTHEFDGEGLLLRAHLAGIPIVDERRIRADLSGRIRVEGTDLWTYLLEATPQTPLLRLFAAVKVGSEPIVALLLAILLGPVLLVLCVLIPLTSSGPIFYRQISTGYLGKPFTLIKFRSMRVDAEANGLRWASDNDDRTTKLGRFMRRTRLDELPQLWNVIHGEMSFCGPRPERPEIYKALAREIPLFPLRTLVRPGITGWAQVYAGYAASVAESALKLEYDLFYIQNISPRLDLIVLAKTIAVALCGDARAPHERSEQSGVPIRPEVS